MPLRYGTLNGHCGGFEGYQDLESRTPARLPELQTLMADMQADVLVVPDSFRWHEFSEADRREWFGYPYSISVGLNDARMRGNGNHISTTILSKREFAIAERVPLAFRDGVHVRIEDDASRPVDIIGGYLYHGDEAGRVAEAYAIRSLAMSLGGRLAVERTVALGDFNTCADRTPRSAVVQLLAQLTSRKSVQLHELAEAHKGIALEILLNSGFIDTSVDHTPTFPAPQFTTELLKGPGTTKALLRKTGIKIPPLIRLDYILASRDMEIVSPAMRVTTPAAKAASDHYPLVAELA